MQNIHKYQLDNVFEGLETDPYIDFNHKENKKLGSIEKKLWISGNLTEPASEI